MQLPRDGKRGKKEDDGKESCCFPFLGSKRGRPHFVGGRKEEKRNERQCNKWAEKMRKVAHAALRRCCVQHKGEEETLIGI